ncbi:SusC/RagA family TonB-linked outer membrane protein [Flavicella sediminum]|uniref:SusC/RagA family TonB-linked outer membrane protein n=1 Tax=Flavicella sediminum TaxID=2585141 RepID=UPI001FB7D0FD|nr:TonB-dependent receptor [Flavicella sediminum]
MKIKNSRLLEKSVFRYTLLALFAICCTLNLQAQQKIPVKGIITGAEDGMPIPGVTIIIQGTSTGTTSDFDGNYVINAKLNDVLIFNYVGMVTKSLKVKSGEINVVLSANVEDLDEVIVIGYGSVAKKEITGAVTRVKAEQLEKIVSSDLGNMLQGQAAGVNVIASADPGGDSEILIRGVTTIAGSNTPLYVVDGIIQEGDPRIAPSDIETIDILKDVASTAIYGSRGATGVILITTKQGTPGSLTVRTNASYSIQHRNAANPLMNSVEQTYFDIVTQRNVVGAFDDEVILRVSTSPVNFQNETNLNDIIFNNNVPTQNYNANISGGTKDITYNVSLGYFNQKGLLINSNFDRFNVRSNTTYTKDKLRIQTSVGMTLEDRDIPQNHLINQTVRYLPTQNTIDLDADEDLESLGGDNSNRLGWVLNSVNTTQNRRSVRTFGSVQLNYKFTEALDLTTNTGLNTTTNYERRFVPHQQVTNLQNGEVSDPSNSSIRMSSSYNTSFYTDAGLNYVKNLDDHKFTGTFYLSYQKQVYDNYWASKTGALNPDIQVLNEAVLDADVGNNSNYNQQIFSALGRIQYAYKGRYLLSSSIRRDGSSRFGKENIFGMFPSTSIGWNISDEDFWQPMKQVVNNFKFRASNGTVGNSRISPYAYAAGITKNIDYVSTNSEGNESIASGAIQVDYANPDIKWETKTETNIGVDLGLFRNKLTISAEYYDISNKDMLFQYTLPSSVGAGRNGNVVLNIGNMTNKGTELTVGYRGKTGKVTWRMNGTFTTNENKITKINGQDDFLYTNDYGLVNGATTQSRVTALAVGREAGAFYLLRTNGIIDTDEKLIAYNALDANAKMGDVIYIDQKTVDTNNDGIADIGDGKISEDDRVYSGSGLPEYELGYRFNANYKNFDFSMNWYAALGQEIMNGGKANAYAYGRHKDLIYQWSPQNTETTIPAYRGDIKKHTNFLGYNDLWLEDGSYLRLRQVTLGYSLPKKTIEKMGINRLRFYVSAQNPLTFTKYTGYNPEVGGGITARGLDKGVAPVSAQYLMGINFNF